MGKTPDHWRCMLVRRRGFILAVLIVLLGGLIFLSNRPDPEENQAQVSAAAQIDRVLQEGQPAWLLFRTTTCPYCVELKKTFQRLEPEYEGRVVFIDINLDDENNEQLGRQYRISYVPQTFIINSAGEITYQMVGNITEDELRRELDQVAQ